MKKIYLAGFDVFRPDAQQYGEQLKTLCEKYGFQGLYPLDNSPPRNLTSLDLARWIYRSNIALIEQSDILMANMNAFRGAEPDSGTVFEVGYATALNKSVWVYTDQERSLVAQHAVHKAPGTRSYVDNQGYTVEDFGLNLNLMIACSAHVIVGSAEDCLQHIDSM
ncbi:nucleoside 2-deoxyribosyltransferase [Candidimonas sp. SYP-B2681]|uniref:nucleoside 2-deoxyribosyltransferase n=1 Tax=Candidimonas sp. SYP-B2681 TaxID=2497686 RepID=UPI000F874B53|nr:nucleoside 2-deoxyribosyltransferase [Candidimonas sp. SYP-B2681]RTZ43353.1 nucleoside 2-deoxyribosyltransferase [Candidimonas sp. SYP-B2681]